MRKHVHSYSSLSTFRQCPRRFEAQYITREFRDPGGPATLRGNLIHEQMEKYILGEREEEPVAVPKSGIHRVYRLLRQSGGPIHVEKQVAVRQDGSACGFFDSDVYLRGKLDIVWVLGQTLVRDWKTGKRRSDATKMQASTYAILAGSGFVPPVEVTFDYLNNGEEPPVCPDAADRQEIWDLMAAVDNSTAFPPRPSPLCRWCPVKTCEFHKDPP